LKHAENRSSKEIHPGERRVAATPQTVMRLQKLGFEVLVETGAGREIDCFDGTYKEAGAAIIEDARELWASSDVIIKVRPPEENAAFGVHETELLRDGGWLVGFVWAAQNKELLNRLAARRATVFAMDCIPRITRAQKMDTLSAMANIAGYRAVIEAANHFPRFFAGQMTAAGKVEPAKCSSSVLASPVFRQSARRVRSARLSEPSTRVRRRAIK
jgi:NAD(P) transhydrogenase subunit alpha